MGNLTKKLESFKDSKEWSKIVGEVRVGQEYKNTILLEGPALDDDVKLYSEADMLRHDITFIEYLQEQLKPIKDKEVKEALDADLEKSRGWRVDRLLGKTNEYKLDNIVEGDSYNEHDLYRSENRWVECFENLPTKLHNIEKEKDIEAEGVEQAEIQEQLDALSNLTEGL